MNADKINSKVDNLEELQGLIKLNKALASSRQVGSTHYVMKSIQPWTAMESWMSPEEFEGFLRGNVIKYIARYKDKDGLKDILKAKHYLEKLLECLETREEDVKRPTEFCRMEQ